MSNLDDEVKKLFDQKDVPLAFRGPIFSISWDLGHPDGDKEVIYYISDFISTFGQVIDSYKQITKTLDEVEQRLERLLEDKEGV